MLKKYSSFSFYKNPQRPFFIKLLASAAKKAVKVMPLFAVRILSRCINKITIDENFTYHIQIEKCDVEIVNNKFTLIKYDLLNE